MDLKFSEEQELLRSSADSFLASRRKQAGGAMPTEEDVGSNWAGIAEMGWLGLLIPEEIDGLGLGHVELSIIAEALGKHLVSVPYVANAVLAAMLVSLLAKDDRKRELLPEIASGETRIGFAHLEAAARDPMRVEVSARRQGDGWVLDGAKTHTLDGNAPAFLVTARIDGGGEGLGLFLLSADTPGATVSKLPLMDGSTAAQIQLSNAQLPDGALVAGGDAVHNTVAFAIDAAIVALCAELIGVADKMLSETVTYVNTREQFGRAISANQVVRHRVVDMAIALEEARNLTLRAAIVLDSGDRAAAARAASAAKVKVGKAARYVAEQSIQLHGAIGVTDELSLGSHLKRVLTVEPLFGTPDHHERRFASLRPTNQRRA